MPELTWTRGGQQAKTALTTAEFAAGMTLLADVAAMDVKRFNLNQARDRKGQWIRVGALVRISGAGGHGGLGTVKEIRDENFVVVERDTMGNGTGSRETIRKTFLTVLDRPKADVMPRALRGVTAQVAQTPAATPRVPPLTGGTLPEGDGHTPGTKFDTPVGKYGMTYSAGAAEDPHVKDLKTDTAAWGDVPSGAYPLSGANLIATEEYLRSKPIDKVVSGTEPFREGYDAHLLRTDNGDVIIDGHHRVAMYIALGRQTMPARIIDERTDPGKPVRPGVSTEAALADAALLKTKPWETVDRKKVYTDEAELAAWLLLERYRGVEPGVTGALTELADSNGAVMHGLQYRFKDQESLARKLEQKSKSKDMTVAQYAPRIGDALRYTVIIKGAAYGATAQAVIDYFRAQGYDVEVQNTWPPGGPRPDYKGINTNMRKDGLTFEVQFHTEKSMAVKDVNHKIYKLVRSADVPPTPEQRAAGRAEMIANAAAQPIPVGAGSVN